jgi:hypothetical protein
MQERGLQNPLLAYAAANNIEAETLSVSESVWRDQGGCIARRNYVPFQSEGVYGPQLMTTPFDFGVGAAATVAAAVAASTGTGVLGTIELYFVSANHL